MVSSYSAFGSVNRIPALPWNNLFHHQMQSDGQRQAHLNHPLHSTHLMAAFEYRQSLGYCDPNPVNDSPEFSRLLDLSCDRFVKRRLPRSLYYWRTTDSCPCFDRCVQVECPHLLRHLRKCRHYARNLHVRNCQQHTSPHKGGKAKSQGRFCLAMEISFAFATRSRPPLRVVQKSCVAMTTLGDRIARPEG
jgi:hypothetical protein